MSAPTRHPLTWPADWKRTASYQRTFGRFRTSARSGPYWSKQALTIAEGVQRVLRELEAMGISENDVIVSTNVQTRLDGLPRSGAAEPADPGVAVYWRAKADAPMRCMAIDAYHRVADNLAAVAATLDAMRAIKRHGGASILDRAFAGFTALPAPDAGAPRPWREVLGFGPDWSGNSIAVNEAYRRLASRCHPDKGGTHAQMAELNRARDEALGVVGP